MPSTVRATLADVTVRQCTGAEARQKSGRARLPALRRGTRQTGRSRLTQLQNHVSWNGAEAGVLPASRLSSPAGSPQTGPFAGRVVSRSRPGADWQFRPRAPLPLHPSGLPSGKASLEMSEIRKLVAETGTDVKCDVSTSVTTVKRNSEAYCAACLADYATLSVPEPRKEIWTRLLRARCGRIIE